MIASLAAENKDNRIAALMLCGYAHENLFEIIKWQYSGASSMLNLCPPFDANKDGRIAREEYESNERTPKVWRERVMKGADFAALDKDSDGELTQEDFRLTVAPAYEKILEKIRENDSDWIWENYFRVSIEWLNEHFKLEPNKDRLLRIEIPIHVFHGVRDANVSVDGVHDLVQRFEKAGKKNLSTYIFDDHDHQLNFFDWVLKDKMSDGFEAIFRVATDIDD